LLNVTLFWTSFVRVSRQKITSKTTKILFLYYYSPHEYNNLLKPVISLKTKKEEREEGRKREN